MKQLFCYSFFMLLIIASCKKIDKQNPSTNNPGDTTVTATGVTKIHIEVPGGSTFSPSGCTAFSSLQSADVDEKGDANAYAYKDKATLVWVFDKDGNPVLAGFISDSSTVISPATTAKVLLYFGLRLHFLPGGAAAAYINSVDKIPDAVAWEQKFKDIFKTDPMTLSTGTFQDDLKDALKKLRDRNTVDINAEKAANLTVDKNDVRSGLQIIDDELSKFSITNNYHRRTYGYLYKMSYKDVNNTSTTLLESISAGTKSTRDFEVASATGVTSLLGEMGKFIEGTLGSSAVVKTGPMELTLGDNESEALYKLRIIGPGRVNDVFMTTTEKDKLESLQDQTFLLDYVIPAFSMLLSIKGADDAANLDAKSVERLIALLRDNQWKNIPELYGEIKQGHYYKAYEKFREYLYTDAGKQFLNEFSAVLAESFSADSKNVNVSSLSKVTKIMAVVDGILTASDSFIRIPMDIAASQCVEEWNITARSSMVTLKPNEEVAFPGSTKKFAAVIKNLGETGDTHPYFEWSTSGKYGYLTDTKGHQGASFQSQDASVDYECNTTESALGDGANPEYIYVKAYYGGQLVGSDTATINVQKVAYKITPNVITLSGRKGQVNEVALRLMRKDGASDIGNNSDFDFKIVWTTAGRYGKLAGRETEGQTTITTYNDNEMWYDCTDDQTKEAEETVEARIYFKEKGDEEYLLMNDATATIKIQNDPNKKIFYVPLSVTHWGPENTGLYTNFGVQSAFLIDPVEHAKSYTATVIEMNAVWNPRVLGTSKTWLASAPLDDDGQYRWGIGSGTSESILSNKYHSQDLQGLIDTYSAWTGTAEVVVTLEPQ